MKKHIVLSILILFIALGSQAQEMLLPLTGNPALKNKAGQGDRIPYILIPQNGWMTMPL
jgi:hypothetical protein